MAWPSPPLSPSRSIKPPRGPLQLPPPIELPHPLLTPTRATTRESRRLAIDGRPELLVTGEHLLGFLTSSLAVRTARTRIPCLELLLLSPNRPAAGAPRPHPSASISSAAPSLPPKPSLACLRVVSKLSPASFYLIPSRSTSRRSPALRRPPCRP
jgi:hypothetical protein